MIECNHEMSNFVAAKWPVMLCLGTMDGTLQRNGWVIVGPQCCDGVSEDGRAPLAYQERDGFSSTPLDPSNDLKQMRSCDASDGQLADLWQDITGEEAFDLP